MKLPHCPVRVFVALCLFLSGVGRAPAAALGDRMIAISARAQIGVGANELIAGFVISGGVPKRVVIRGVGPGLTGFAGSMADPKLTLYNGQGLPIATNDNWLAADAAAMAEAGTSAFIAGSKDAALVLTLDPGVYTAIVNGVNNTTGVGLVEVYDLGDAPKFIGLSAHANVGVGADVLVAGFAVRNTAGSRRIFVRATGPALTAIGVANALLDPQLTVYNGSGAVIASNDNWGTGDAAAVASYTAQVGAVAFAPNSKDASLVVDLPQGNYTMHVSGVGNTSGIIVLEAFDMTSDAMVNSTVSVAASSAITSYGTAPAVFTFTRTGDTSSALTVGYSLGGTAIPGVDYTGASGTATFAAGASTTTVTITPAVTTASSAAKTITLTLTPSSNYALGAGAEAAAGATIFYTTTTLYVANLRPTSGAATSTAYGTATLKLSDDEKYVTLSSGFSNLSSAQTVSYLRIGVQGGQETDLFLMPLGQVSGAVWQIAATGTNTVASIVAAIKSGQGFLSIETANFPTGELRGTFIQNIGSQVFSPPVAPPALPSTPPTATEAARFLQQATFGTKQADIDAVMQKGYATWIAEQMAMPATSHRTGVQADFILAPPANGLAANQANRMAAWWKVVLTGNDQLRQRVAFALSEIFVISEAGTNFNNYGEAVAAYYDMLGGHAFGNFRTLLEDVTLNPLMGTYLSSLRNSKATPNATTGIYSAPDENYAREVMQLFTIGLNELQPDGTLRLDASGLPIATYNQTTITETAKVFTGWAFNSAGRPNASFTTGGQNYFLPMSLYPASHDDTQKTIVGGKVIPANQGGTLDLKDTLDALFNHANTGPFISRQLIQRLVTSNPSPAYVYRVAQVFANNGSGVRGDLGAVIRAILTDYEARSSAVVANPGFGKLKEPLLRLTSILRSFNMILPTTGGNAGRFVYGFPENDFSQGALRSPTVFNFFEPFYVLPGTLAAAGLYAPEYQILTATTAITGPNRYYSYIYSTGSNNVTLDLNAVLPLATQPGPLVDQLNLLLCGGAATTAQKDTIVAALNAMPSNTSTTERVRSAIYLLISTPAGAIQK